MQTLTSPRRSRAAGSSRIPRSIPRHATAVDWTALERRFLTPERLSLALDRLIDDLLAREPGATSKLAPPTRDRRPPQHARGQHAPGRTASPRC